MLSINDHTGTVTFLLGTVVVVMAGIGLTVVVDKRIVSSSRDSIIREDMGVDFHKIETIKTRIALLSSRLSEIDSSVQYGEAYEKMQSHLTHLREKRSALALKLRDEKRSIGMTAEIYTSYRDLYRKTVRAAAIGEELGDLKTRDGRVYSKVVIVKVTGIGLEIRHQSGTARVIASDLETSFQDRFQWD